MAKFIVSKLLVMKLLLYSNIFTTDVDDFINPTDDMFETADYLIVLNQNISKHIKKLNPSIIPLLDSFSKYIDYLADKIELGSNKELKIIKTFGRVVDGPAFLDASPDLTMMLEELNWNYTVSQRLRDALNEASALWSRLTVVLAEHVQERTYLQKNQKNCNLPDDCDSCEKVC